MSERREQIIFEIREIAERIELKLSDYRTKFYREMPVVSRKKLCEWLEKAVIETEILVFYNGTGEYLFMSNVIEANSKYNITNIYNYLENAVNEVLKYYNESIAGSVSELIDLLENKLLKIGCKVKKEFRYLITKFDISECIETYEEKFPDLVELQDTISIIKNIDSIGPGTLTPDIHELYGVRALLLELEEKIEIIETMEDSSCINVILEYIDYMIDWKWFKDIR